MNLNRDSFFSQYSKCANKETLIRIWGTKDRTTLYIQPDYEITDLSPITIIKRLEFLYINNSRIIDLSPLKECHNLVSLDISKCQVYDISPLENLLNLARLNISETLIENLSSLKNLINLERVNLTSTPVKDISPLRHLIEKNIDVRFDNPNTNGIIIRNTQLVNPPMPIVKLGVNAILRYWSERERIGATKIRESRLLLVGQGGAGKTTLKIKLKDINAPMPLSEETTRGINIDHINFKPNLDDPSKFFEIEEIETKTSEGAIFTVKVWDFGGQNIQHYAHQFFMSDSVVYAVLSNTREQNTNFQYWLNIIELLGKDSPFFIVQNEREGHKEPLRDVIKIQERFPDTFQSIEQVNLKEAATDPRFEALKIKLLHSATQLPHTQREVLTSFFNIRQKLEDLAQSQQTLPFREFQKLCTDEGIEDRELMNDYARLMTELGIALYFHDDIYLKSQVFLNPKWIIDALFELLYHPSVVEQNNGHFTETEADAIWSRPEYDDMHGILLKLMVKFCLCYETKEDGQYIVPQRLPERKEPFESPEDTTHLIYKYKFLPSGLLTQLTCVLHSWIEDEKVWSDAVQFIGKNGNGHVFVRENYATHLIELFGFGVDKAEMLNRVVDTLDTIHLETKLKNLVVEKQVPCPCKLCSRSSEVHFYKYDVLKSYFQEDTTEKIRCEKSKEKILVAAIMKHANIRAFRIEEIQNLVGENRLGEAIELLKGLFPNETELILLESRFNQLENEDRIGLNDIKLESSMLQKNLLATAKKLLKV